MKYKISVLYESTCRGISRLEKLNLINQRVLKPLVPHGGRIRLRCHKQGIICFLRIRRVWWGTRRFRLYIRYFLQFISLHRIGLSRRMGMMRITAAGSATSRWTLIWTQPITR